MTTLQTDARARNGRRRVLTLAAAALAAPAVRAQAPRRITIGTSSNSMPASVLRMARELGLFEKHGLAPQITPMDSGSVATMGLISGSLDFTSSAPTDVIVSQARGQKLVALFSTYVGFPGVFVIAKSVAARLPAQPNAPIAERLKALDGLLIASPSATSTYTFTPKSATESVGAKLRFTYMAQPAMVAALETGAVQGFVASAPSYARSVLSGAGVIWIAGPKNELPQQFVPVHAITVNTRRDYAEANRDTVQRVAAVCADFGRAVDERPAEVKAAIARLYPEVDARTLDLFFETESTALKGRPPTVREMQADIQYTRQSGIPLPDIDKIDPASMVFR